MSIDLQSRLLRLSEYDISLNTHKGNYIVSIHFKDKWKVIKPKSKEILFTADKEDSTLYYYVSPISNDINTIFDSIDETVKYNEELELKLTLFSEKIKELQDFFSKTPYKELRTLRFVTEKQRVVLPLKEEKPQVKKKRKSKKAVEKPTISEPIESAIPQETVEETSIDENDIDSAISRAMKKKGV